MDYGLQNIGEVFNLMHDGRITEARYDESELNLRVEIRYLAEVVDDSFKFFFVTLVNCRSMAFKPWDSDGTVMTDSTRIFDAKFDILEARVNRNYVEISCTLTPESAMPYRGGEIIVSAGGIQVYDQDLNRVEVTDLKKISRRYWKNFTH